MNLSTTSDDYPQVTGNLSELVRTGLRFSTIYCDPPWPYENRASRGAACNHYNTMAMEDILALPVPELANSNAHLHLWTTSSFLREAFQVFDAWGFEYKSGLVWIKQQMGTGNYWRMSHEYLLLGVRGQLRFRERKHPSWVSNARSKHSRKPAIFRHLIERVSPGPYLELFGREQIPDGRWTVFGDQIQPSYW